MARQGDISAHGFPRDLDGHPALAWMGDDWVSYIALRLLEQFRAQVPGTEMTRIGCVGAPSMEVRSAADGAVRAVTVRVGLEMMLASGEGEARHVQGRATFTGPHPVTVIFEIATGVDELAAVLREAREYVARPDNDFLYSSWEDTADALEEIDEFLSRLARGPVRTSELGGLFAPTGPMHELAVASGWSAAFSDLVARFDAVRMVARGTWSCHLCGREAGAIELGESGELRRDAFTSRLTQTVRDPGAFGRLWDAIASGNSAAVHGMDPELAPWWCQPCARIYCGDHWQRWDVFDDEGFHDCIRGRCPEGHERMLED